MKAAKVQAELNEVSRKKESLEKLCLDQISGLISELPQYASSWIHSYVANIIKQKHERVLQLGETKVGELNQSINKLIESLPEKARLEENNLREGTCRDFQQSSDNAETRRDTFRWNVVFDTLINGIAPVLNAFGLLEPLKDSPVDWFKPSDGSFIKRERVPLPRDLIQKLNAYYSPMYEALYLNQELKSLEKQLKIAQAEDLFAKTAVQ